MINVYPAYYKSFKCIADKCKNNCCIGWEIDIDETTYEAYMNTKGELGKKLRDNISSDETPCFILSDGERCPFLNRSNLCEIILSEGEQALCNICKDHPRFRNFFEGVTENGIGLACEEAARVVLDENAESGFICDGDIKSDEEYCSFSNFRSKLFSIIENRENEPEARISKALELCGLKEKEISAGLISAKLSSLEILNEEWKDVIKELEKYEGNIRLPFENSIKTEKLISYFIFRHLAEGYFDGDVCGVIAFSVLSARIINLIVKLCGITYEEAARRFSSEIEYSAENTGALISFAEEYYDI